MTQNKRKKYVSPQVEVIRMENEGVIAASGLSDMNVSDWGGGANSAKRSYNSASNSDLEDMISDILTVGE